MVLKNLIVQVTKEGAVWNKTAGKNIKIRYDRMYELDNGFVGFNREGSELFVTYKSRGGVILYKSELELDSMYFVTKHGAKVLNQSEDSVRRLYSRLKGKLGTPKFSIVSVENLDTPFKIKLRTYYEGGKFNYRFTVKVKPSVLTKDMIHHIYMLIEEASKLELEMIVNHYKGFEERNEIVLSVSEEFLEIATEVERIEKRKADRKKQKEMELTQI